MKTGAGNLSGSQATLIKVLALPVRRSEVPTVFVARGEALMKKLSDVNLVTGAHVTAVTQSLEWRNCRGLRRSFTVNSLVKLQGVGSSGHVSFVG